MNLWEAGLDSTLLEQALGKVRHIGNPEPAISVNVLPINGRDIPLFDLWHFPAAKAPKRFLQSGYAGLAESSVNDNV